MPRNLANFARPPRLVVQRGETIKSKKVCMVSFCQHPLVQVVTTSLRSRLASLAAHLFGSAQLKLLVNALNMCARHVSKLSQVVSLSQLLGSLSLQVASRFFKSGTVLFLVWELTSTMIWPDSRSSTSSWKCSCWRVSSPADSTQLCSES